MIMISLIKVIINTFTSKAGKSQKWSGTGRIGEPFEDCESLQQYGLASHPPSGSEGISLKAGNTVYLIASDNRRYRIDTKPGEVAIYTDEGDSIHLKRGHEIEVNAKGESSAKISINAKGLNGNVEINAEGIDGKCVVNAANVYLGSEMLADGVVTGMCSCSITGAPHPIKSLHVKAIM